MRRRARQAVQGIPEKGEALIKGPLRLGDADDALLGGPVGFRNFIMVVNLRRHPLVVRLPGLICGAVVQLAGEVRDNVLGCMVGWRAVPSEASVSHRAAVYRFYVWADGARREPCLLGDLDGHGTSLQDVIANYMPSFISHNHDKSRGIHCCTVDSQGIETFLVLCHDEKGVASEIHDGSRVVRRSLASTEHVRCGVLFRFPPSGLAGSLAVHVNNGRDVMAFLENGLQALLAKTGRILEFMPHVVGKVMEQAMKQDSLGMRDVVKFGAPADPAAAVAEPWINLGRVARYGVRFAPRHAAVERLLGSLPPPLQPQAHQPFGDFVEIRGAARGEVAIDVEAGGALHRYNLERPEAGHAVTEEMIGLQIEDGQLTEISLLAALRHSLSAPGAT